MDAHVAWQLSVLFISILSIVVDSESVDKLRLSDRHWSSDWKWLRFPPQFSVCLLYRVHQAGLQVDHDCLVRGKLLEDQSNIAFASLDSRLIAFSL